MLSLTKCSLQSLRAFCQMVVSFSNRRHNLYCNSVGENRVFCLCFSNHEFVPPFKVNMSWAPYKVWDVLRVTGFILGFSKTTVSVLLVLSGRFRWKLAEKILGCVRVDEVPLSLELVICFSFHTYRYPSRYFREPFVRWLRNWLANQRNLAVNTNYFTRAAIKKCSCLPSFWNNSQVLFGKCVLMYIRKS